MTYDLKRWNEALDLSLADFYNEAKRRGFTNNASRLMLVDSLSREREWAAWLLYCDDRVIGTVGAHSFPEMGEHCYRIAARTCVFTDMIPGIYGKALRTKSVITNHQNPTAQFLIPICIEWAPENSKLFITSNENTMGAQRKVHNIFAPLMERQGIMTRLDTIHYRGTYQTVWQFFPQVFYKQINRYPRWQ